MRPTHTWSHTACRQAETGKKTQFLRHLMLKMIDLPRQARDKHRENLTILDAFSYRGLQRMGAIHLEGTRNVAIEHCLVTRVDGNAIMLSGYNRNTSILRNEFVWIGDSVIASWVRKRHNKTLLLISLQIQSPTGMKADNLTNTGSGRTTEGKVG